jgi:hypothetical protein
MNGKSLGNRLIRFLPWVLVILLALASLALFYHLVDQAVTIDHGNMERGYVQKQRDVLRCTAEVTAKGISREQLFKILDRTGFQHFTKGNEVVAGGVNFSFKDDHLIQIRTDE